MNKIIFLLAVILTIIASTTSAFADSNSTQIYAAYAQKTPVIDGILSQDEWSNTVEYILDDANAAECEGEADSKTQMLFYLMWDESGLYLSGKVFDKTIAQPVRVGLPLNTTDAVQLGINPTNVKGNEIDDAYFFSFVTKTSQEYPANWFEHFVFGASEEDTGINIAGERNDEYYTVEIFIPWDALKKKEEDFTAAEGMEIGVGITCVDYDENGKSLAIYKSWPSWQITKYNTMVLCAKDWEISIENEKDQKSFASESVSAPAQSEETVESSTESGSSEISLIVFIFAAILFGSMLILINNWKERTNEK